MPRRPSVRWCRSSCMIVLVFSRRSVMPIGSWPAAKVVAFEQPPRIVLHDIAADDEDGHRSGRIRPAHASRSIAAPPSVEPESGTGSDRLSTGTERVGDLDSLPGGISMPPAPVALPPPQPKTPIRPHSGVKPPARVVYVAPVYPLTARAVHKDGVVIIEATIDEQGNFTDTQLLRSIPLLDEAALVAVRQWKFSPTLLNGTPVSIVMTVTVNFTLTQ